MFFHSKVAFTVRAEDNVVLAKVIKSCTCILIEHINRWPTIRSRCWKDDSDDIDEETYEEWKASLSDDLGSGSSDEDVFDSEV